MKMNIYPIYQLLIKLQMYQISISNNLKSKEIFFLMILSNFFYFSVYWPYKFWQHHQQPKLTIDNNDTCERATSPVRILTPAKRLSTPSVLNQSIQSSHSSSRLTSDCSSRRSNRVTTSRNTSTDNNNRSISANFRGKTPLI